MHDAVRYLLQLRNAMLYCVYTCDLLCRGACIPPYVILLDYGQGYKLRACLRVLQIGQYCQHKGQYQHLSAFPLCL